MSLEFITRISVIGIFVIALGLGLSCCDGDNPVNPPPDDNDTVDYVAYFADASFPNTYFAYHTASKTVDSFILPYSSRETAFDISPDGNTMYMNPPGYIVEVDLDSLTVIAEHPTIAEGDELIVSPDGRILAAYNRDLYFIDLSDMSVAWLDSNTAFHGRFTFDGHTFLCCGGDTMGSHVRRIDMRDGFQETKRYFTGGMIWRVVPNTENTSWFLFKLIYDEVFQFQVYDAVNDSITFSYDLCPGYGDMEKTPDGQYVVFSQPGTIFGICPPPDYFTIFDVTANDIHRQVSTVDICDLAIFVPGGLCITPDGRHLIATWANGGGWLFDFNMATMEYDTCLFLGHDKFLIGLTCQSSPKTQ